MDATRTPLRRTSSSGRAGGRLVLGRYELAERLGSGGFGAVWAAHDRKLGREVAVKAVPRGAGGDEARLEREALAAARLSHPGIVTLFEAGADADSCYLVSELVHGDTLERLCADGALSDRDVVRIGLALCDALAHAHARGVVHRDVKPANVLVPERAESAAGVAKLADFGVAHLAGDEALTRTGDVIGTLAYMAPEQAAGERVSPATDLYALALVLYEALAGSNPVRAAGAAATARRVGKRIAPLGRARRDLPAGLCAAIDEALDPEPAMRGTVEDLRAALAASIREVGDEEGFVAGSPVEGLRGRRRLGFGARVLAGVAAGASVLAGALLVPEGTPGAAAAAAGIVAVAVALLPRAGWLACAGAACAWLSLPASAGGAGLPGAALLAAVCLGPGALLLRRPEHLSAPAAGAGLGLVGAALAYPVLAGQARAIRDRIGLACAGALAATAACAAAGAAHPLGPFASPPAGWERSAAITLDAVLWPAAGEALALAAIWACAAAVLPVAVRGASGAAAAIGALAWTAGLTAACAWAAHGFGTPAEAAGRLVAPALLAAAGAAGAAVLRARRARPVA